MVTAEICAFVLKAMARWSPKTTENNHEKPLTIQLLDLKVPVEVTRSIPKVRAAVIDQAQDLQLDYHVFSKFGKQRLKELKLHPDAFVQVMIQAAAFKTHKEYEFHKKILNFSNS